VTACLGREQAKAPRVGLHDVGGVVWSILWDKHRIFKTVDAAEAEEWVQVCSLL
jgi:hypothetical protein